MSFIDIKFFLIKLFSFETSILSNFSIFDINAKNDYHNTYNSLLESYKLNNKKICNGIITLPLDKSIISRKVNNNFLGQT